MEDSKPISSFIDEELKRFSLYVCYHRAIPNMIDGFKPAQRKAFHVLRSKKDFIKVQSVAGRMISEANYNHGDSSASETISRMAQDFTGSNNIAPFIGKGAFGSKFIKEASAPRYIYVKPNPNFHELYNDFDLCEPDHDPESPEPRFFLPVIPTILLNGVNGIAVGFATRILPYHILDVCMNVRKVLNGEPQEIMAPWFSGYSGGIEWDYDKDRPVQMGSYRLVNTTTVKVEEVPTSFDREQYHKLLVGLEDRGLIRTFEDRSKTHWDIDVRLPRKSKVFDDPHSHLGLVSPLNENITVIDQNGGLRVFETPHDLIEEFVAYRLKVYAKRIEHRLDEIREEADLVKAKIRFVAVMASVDFRRTTRAGIVKRLRKAEFRNGHIEACMKMAATNLNTDYVRAKKVRLEQLKSEYQYYKRVTPAELYKIDLDSIEEKFKE